MEDKIYHVCVECSPIHVDNCETCFGWGFKKDSQTPIAAAEAKDEQESDPCPECGGTRTNEHLYKLEKQSRRTAIKNGKIKMISFSKEDSKGTLRTAL